MAAPDGLIANYREGLALLAVLASSGLIKVELRLWSATLGVTQSGEKACEDVLLFVSGFGKLNYVFFISIDSFSLHIASARCSSTAVITARAAIPGAPLLQSLR